MHTGDAPDVVVVGGGIVGTATAAFLAGAGATVTLVEREGLASGASGANSGVVQHPFDPVLAALYRETVALYRDLATLSNAFPFSGRPTGLLYISTAEQAARQQARLIGQRFPELASEVVGGRALRDVEPAAGDDLWACRVDIGYPVMPGASTYAYATLAESRGAVIRTGRSAELAVDGDAVVGIRVDGRRLEAGAVVAAAGPWTPALLDPAGRWVPILPRWGVVVEAELAAPPRHVLEEAGIEAALDAGGEPAVRADTTVPAVAAPGHRDVEPDAIEFSLVPLPGAAAVGSTFLPAEPNSAAWMEPILERATRFVPGVSDAPIRGVRACARPQSVDGRPLIGAVPGRRNLYVCAGPGRGGSRPARRRHDWSRTSCSAGAPGSRPSWTRPASARRPAAETGASPGRAARTGAPWRERMGVEPTARRRAPRHRC